MRRRLNVVDKLGAAWNFMASADRAPVRASVNRVLAARADHAREVRMRHGHMGWDRYFGRSSQIVIVWHGSGLAMLSPMLCVSQRRVAKKGHVRSRLNCRSVWASWRWVRGARPTHARDSPVSAVSHNTMWYTIPYQYDPLKSFAPGVQHFPLAPAAPAARWVAPAPAPHNVRERACPLDRGSHTRQ